MNRKSGLCFFSGLAVLFLIAFTDRSGSCQGQEPSAWSVPAGVSETIIVPVSDDELMGIVKQALSAGGHVPASIRQLEVDSFGPVYLPATQESNARVFARFVARRVPCGDCHDVFFVYSFDGYGILKFIPVSITKQYNKKWAIEDVEKIENRFIGKSFRTPVPFNPFVDAVSSATMSSKIVFYSMNETGAIYDKLVEMGVAERHE